MPTPRRAPTVGTDEYRCFLLDPKITKDAVITGTDFLPANPQLVHHVILYKVDPEDVAAAKAKDSADPGDGWTCFGGTGLGGGAGQNIWRALARRVGSRRHREVAEKGIGTPLPKGSQIVMPDPLQPDQRHRSGPERRRAADRHRQRLPTATSTRLLPAPVEMPCRTGVANTLCARDAAMADNIARFGAEAKTADLLHILCGAGPVGPTQSCTTTAGGRWSCVRSQATCTSRPGHLRGRQQGTPRAKTLLDITNWDFDNQGLDPIGHPHYAEPEGHAHLHPRPVTARQAPAF